MAQRARAIKPLSEPIDMEVETDSEGLPTSVSLAGLALTKEHKASHKRLKVLAIEDIYKINELWWRGPEQEIERLYFDVRLENGRPITIFKDLISETWQRQTG